MSLFSPTRSQIFAYGSEYYEASDEYDNSTTGFSGTYYYYGFLNNTGAWIIQQYSPTAGTYRYAQGSGLSSYETAFAACVAGSPPTFGYFCSTVTGEGR